MGLGPFHGGKSLTVRISKKIRAPLEKHSDGANVVGGVTGVISANVNEPGSSNRVSTRQSVRVVQRGGKTKVFESTSTDEGNVKGEPND
jgi:hypothetical protein